MIKKRKKISKERKDGRIKEKKKIYTRPSSIPLFELRNSCLFCMSNNAKEAMVIDVIKGQSLISYNEFRLCAKHFFHYHLDLSNITTQNKVLLIHYSHV